MASDGAPPSPATGVKTSPRQSSVKAKDTPSLNGGVAGREVKASS
jgi:hypothetical protein